MFVDDLRPNVRAAVAAGMVGVQHVEVAVTLDDWKPSSTPPCADARPVQTSRCSTAASASASHSYACWADSGARQLPGRDVQVGPDQQ